MLTPALFTENVFDHWFDDFGLMKEMNDLEKKLYGKHASREMLTDVKEHEDHYDLEIDLPGFRKENITAELNNGWLTITASKDHETENKDKEGKILRQERCSGTMSRSFWVGEEVKEEDIHGRYEGGVLTLYIPKKEETAHIENKRIMIE
ncbi:MAG: Hsp20/alpha crystallin family protein [Solobacterium sp.]|nr:Hsp20/alpha crystallin family protein [Solobacterium sp.]